MRVSKGGRVRERLQRAAWRSVRCAPPTDRFPNKRGSPTIYTFTRWSSFVQIFERHASKFAALKFLTSIA